MPSPPEPSAACRLYRALLKKHSSLISEAEKKTVGEMKTLVNPEDLSLQALLSEFLPPEYQYPGGYAAAAQKAYEFVSREIQFAPLDLGLACWLSPTEILREKAADDENLAIFLCSLLAALGDKNASVVIAELEGLSTHAAVITDLDSSFLLLDPAQQHPFLAFWGPDSEVLSRYSFQGKKLKRFLYKFNRAEFKQFV